MKIVTWNVNGIRACLNKGFMDYVKEADPDIICVQEAKCTEGAVTFEGTGYYQYWNYAEKAGYSGTIILTKQKPEQAYLGMVEDDFNHEGRVLTADYGDFFLVNVYVPNAQQWLVRLPFRKLFDEALRGHVYMLQSRKPVILCGDMNVAHNSIDLARPDSNFNSPGFSYDERNDFDMLLDVGLIDAYRYLYPDIGGAYSYWSYMRNAREKNIGWRLDYFLLTESLKDRIQDVVMRKDVLGSDHCPVELYLS